MASGVIAPVTMAMGEVETGVLEAGIMWRGSTNWADGGGICCLGRLSVTFIVFLPLGRVRTSVRNILKLNYHFTKMIVVFSSFVFINSKKLSSGEI